MVKGNTNTNKGAGNKKAKNSVERKKCAEIILMSFVQFEKIFISFQELYTNFIELSKYLVEILANNEGNKKTKETEFVKWYYYWIGIRDEYCLLHYGGGYLSRVVEGRKTHNSKPSRDFSSFMHTRKRGVIAHEHFGNLELGEVLNCSERGLKYSFTEFEVIYYVFMVLKNFHYQTTVFYRTYMGQCMRQKLLL